MQAQRDHGFRRQYFPDAERDTFNTAAGGFVPLSVLYRKLIRHLSLAESRILNYLILRSGAAGICYPDQGEMLRELGLKSLRSLDRHLQSLVAKHFIRMNEGNGRRYFLVFDPRVTITRLVADGKIQQAELTGINRLLADLKQPRIGNAGERTSAVCGQQF